MANLSFACESCGKSYECSDDLAGRSLRCKQCGSVVRIPGGSVRANSRVQPSYAGQSSAPMRFGPPAAEKTFADERPFGGREGSGSMPLSKMILIGGGVGAVLVVFLLIIVTVRSNRPNSPNGQGVRGVGVAGSDASRQKEFVIEPNGDQSDSFDDSGGRPVLAADDATITVPNFPDLDAGREIEPGIMFYEVKLGPPQPDQNVPVGHSGKLWVYLPKGDAALNSLPCVLITGAGSNLLTGMELSDGDRPEHLPYARAGFAVVAYELDGYIGDPQQANDAAHRRGMAQFLRARSGLVNARNAIEFTLKKLPQVDPARLYTAGHSSAATISLLVAEYEPRIAACVAYNPRVDLGRHLAGPLDREWLKAHVANPNAYMNEYNPRKNEAKLKCPVFLFHTLDDSVVPASESRDMASRFRSEGKSVTLVLGTKGGHHDPMIEYGIPRAIDWLIKLPESAKEEGETIDTSVSVASGAPSNRNGNNNGGSSTKDPKQPQVIIIVPNDPNQGGARGRMMRPPIGPRGRIIGPRGRFGPR